MSKIRLIYSSVCEMTTTTMAATAGPARGAHRSAPASQRRKDDGEGERRGQDGAYISIRILNIVYILLV